MPPRRTSGPATPDLGELFRPYAAMMPDWSKALQDMSAPGRFWQEMLASHQRNIESVTKLNDGVAGAMRQIAERQLQLMQTTMAELSKLGETMRKPGGAQAALSPDAASEAFERALTTMREIAEIAEKANRDALEAITERSQEFQHELQALMKPAGKGG